jgi:hypothetical protein
MRPCCSAGKYCVQSSTRNVPSLFTAFTAAGRFCPDQVSGMRRSVLVAGSLEVVLVRTGREYCRMFMAREAPRENARVRVARLPVGEEGVRIVERKGDANVIEELEVV